MDNPTHFILVYRHGDRVYQTDVILIKHFDYFVNNSINWDLPILYIAKIKCHVAYDENIFLSNPNRK